MKRENIRNGTKQRSRQRDELTSMGTKLRDRQQKSKSNYLGETVMFNNSKINID